MKDLLLLAIGTALVHNIVLSQFLGLCPFFGVSKNMKTAAGMGGAVIFVVTLSSTLTSVVYHYILIPLEIAYLQIIVFVLLIAALVQFVEMFLKKNMKLLYRALGVYLPLITTNCVVLGASLINVQKGYNLIYGILNGLFSSLGFCIAIVILAGIRERIEYNDIPPSLKGTPIIMITSGLMAIAFIGFAGILT